MGKYPVLSQSAQDTEEIYFQQYNQVQKVETDHQTQEHLLAVYQSELKSLTIETRKKEYPMATIQFRTGILQSISVIGVIIRCIRPLRERLPC